MYLIKLKKLHCGRNQNFTDRILKHLDLVSLHCGWNENFTDDGLKYLINLRKLKCGGNINFTDKGLFHLNLTCLECLRLNKKITYKSVIRMNGLTKLECGNNKELASYMFPCENPVDSFWPINNIIKYISN